MADCMEVAPSDGPSVEDNDRLLMNLKDTQDILDIMFSKDDYAALSKTEQFTVTQNALAMVNSLQSYVPSKRKRNSGR